MSSGPALIPGETKSLEQELTTRFAKYKMKLQSLDLVHPGGNGGDFDEVARLVNDTEKMNKE